MHRMHARPLYAPADAHANAHVACCRTTCILQVPPLLREQPLLHTPNPGRSSLTSHPACVLCMIHSVAIARHRASPVKSTDVLPVSYRFVCAHNRLQARAPPSGLDKRPSQARTASSRRPHPCLAPCTSTRQMPPLILSNPITEALVPAPATMLCTTSFAPCAQLAMPPSAAS
jgi:hypothetical protein